MKIFYDWEFEEKVYPSGKVIVPISFGAVTMNGKELYIINDSYDWASSNNWLKENVLPILKSPRKRKDTISLDVKSLSHINFGSTIAAWVKSVNDSEPVELIGYFSDYDHVLVSQCFRSFDDFPKDILPMFSYDLKQWISDLNNPVLLDNLNEHNALSDARWNKDIYNYLSKKFYHPKWSENYDKAMEALTTVFNNLDKSEVEEGKHTLDSELYIDFVKTYQKLIF